MTKHVSVMPVETLDLLDVKQDGIYVDGTLGRGGHSKLILEKLKNGEIDIVVGTHKLLGKEIEFKDIVKVIWKEIRVAFFCGVTLAVANFAKILLLDHLTIGVTAVICLSLVVTVFFAKVVGCTLPMIAQKIGFDPAVMASPFITTIVDALSLMIYFQFATHILNI